MDDTPLGRTVGIRMEKDPNTLKNYGKHENTIRAEWRVFKSEQAISENKAFPEKDKRQKISELQKILQNAFGKGGVS